MAHKALLAITGAFSTPGGIAAVNRLVICALYDFGFDITIHSLNDSILMENRSCIEKPYNHVRVFAGNKFAFSLATWIAISRTNYNLIMVDHVNLASILSPLSKLVNLKYYVWCFGVEVFHPRPDREGRMGLLGASRCVTISEFTKGKVLEQFPKLNIDVCEPALNLAALDISLLSSNSICPESLNLQAVDGSRQVLGSKVILHVGRMDTVDKYKGQDRLLAAFPLIQEMHPNSQLILVGEGVDAKRLREIACSLSEKHKKRIFMPGYIADDLLRRLYQRCYLFAMPSTGEGFGLVYLEAMAHARPCLGGSVDASSCVIRKNETGVIVDDPRDTQEIAQKIVGLLDQPDLAEKMGHAGFDLVCSHYLYPHFRDRFEKIINPS